MGKQPTIMRHLLAFTAWLFVCLVVVAYAFLTTAYFIAFWGDLPWWCVTLECIYSLALYLAVICAWGYVQAYMWERTCMDYVFTLGLYALANNYYGLLISIACALGFNILWTIFFAINIWAADGWYFTVPQLMCCLLLSVYLGLLATLIGLDRHGGPGMFYTG